MGRRRRPVRRSNMKVWTFLAIGLYLLTSFKLSWMTGTELPLQNGAGNKVDTVQTLVVSPRSRQRQTMAPRASSENTMGFVHVGKTGGSTISQLLRNGCTSFVTGPCRNITHESMVSKLVEHYYHVPDFHRLPTSNHRSFTITVRDVYDRTVSSFLYHHPKNAAAYHVRLTKAHAEYGPLAYSCFDTLEEFATLLKGISNQACDYPHRHNVVDATNCAALACAALHGKVRVFIHLFFNFQNILYTKIPTDDRRQFYALRQEKLWQDWEQLNVLLGQEEPVYIPTSDFNQRNVSGVVSRDISDKGRQYLCQSLEKEYIAYFRILKLAQNIQEQEMKTSVQVAKKNCPTLDFQSILAEASKQ